MKSRAEDPNITLRVIEKIKDKYKHYYRDTSSLQLTPLISDLLNDITMLKKDCMVASELAQQYIMKSFEHYPSGNSRSEQFKLNYELARISEENTALRAEIVKLNEENSSLNSQEFIDVKEEIHIPESENHQIRELEKQVAEYQNIILIDELKSENIISDLTDSNKGLTEKNIQLQNSLSEYESRVDGLERKLKESLSGYSKFLVRKKTENKDCQVLREFIIENGSGIEIQRHCEVIMNLESCQLSRMSITESEIFDVTGIHLFDIVPQGGIEVLPLPLEIELSRFRVIDLRTRELQDSKTVFVDIQPIKKLEKERYWKTCLISSQNVTPQKKALVVSNQEFLGIHPQKNNQDISLYKHEGIQITSKKALAFEVSQAEGINITCVTLRHTTNLAIFSESFLSIQPELKKPDRTLITTQSQSISFLPTKPIRKQLDIIEVSSLQISVYPKSLTISHQKVYSSPFESQQLEIVKGLVYDKLPAIHQLNLFSVLIFSQSGTNAEGMDTENNSPIKELEVSRMPAIDIKFEKKHTVPVLSSFKVLSLIRKTILSETNLENICVKPGSVEESKAPSRRRGSVQPRKPAIEEYFALTYQAIKMLGAKSGKVFTSDEMYKKATDEGIPFFTWHDWLKTQMN